MLHLINWVLQQYAERLKILFMNMGAFNYGYKAFEKLVAVFADCAKVYIYIVFRGTNNETENRQGRRCTLLSIR